MPYNISKKSQQIPQKHTNIDRKTTKITEVIILIKKLRVTSKLQLGPSGLVYRCSGAGPRRDIVGILVLLHRFLYKPIKICKMFIKS